MGTSLLGFLISTDYRNKGVVAAQTALKGLGGQVQNVGKALGVFNLSGLASAGIVAGMATAVKKAVGDYVAYNDQVRQNMNLTGTSAEQTSRLMQLTDDYGISSEKLKTILEGANKKGFQPSIDNLAALSDEYLALNDPVEKNQLLTEKLGKGGMALAEVMKLGGAAIREKAAATKDGLIVDEAALENSWDFKMAIDDLEDAFTAMANTLAKTALPRLTDFLKFMMRGIEVGEQLANKTGTLKTVWDEHNTVMQDTNVTYEEYITEMERAAEAAGYDWEAIMLLNDGTQEFGTSQDYLIENWGMMSPLQWENRNASQAWMDELDRGGPILEDVADGVGALLEPIDLVSGSMQELTLQLLYNKAAAGLDEEASLALARQLGLVDEATYAALNMTQQYRDQLEAGKITADEYVDLIAAIPVAYGLIPQNITTTLTIDVAVKGDPIPDFGISDPDAPVTYTTEDDTVYGGMRAAGGPVSSDQWYWVGEHGPEPFYPKQDGVVMPNGAAGASVTINWNGNVRSDTDIELIARKLADLMQRRR